MESARLTIGILVLSLLLPRTSRSSENIVARRKNGPLICPIARIIRWSVIEQRWKTTIPIGSSSNGEEDGTTKTMERNPTENCSFVTATRATPPTRRLLSLPCRCCPCTLLPPLFRIIDEHGDDNTSPTHRFLPLRFSRKLSVEKAERRQFLCSIFCHGRMPANVRARQMPHWTVPLCLSDHFTGPKEDLERSASSTSPSAADRPLCHSEWTLADRM